MSALARGNKKLFNAWAFYDQTNSVYSLTIVSIIFPIFYGLLSKAAQLTHISLFGILFKSISVIAFITTSAFLLVILLFPILSDIADFLGNKKSFMHFFCCLGAVSYVGLYWFSLEHIYFGLICYFCEIVGFWGSIVFYNSYLPNITLPKQYDAVGTKGYSLSYASSVLLLVLNLIVVMKPKQIGFENVNTTALTTMRISFITVGIWWIGFSSIPFGYLPSYHSDRGKLAKNILFNGFKELRKVWQSLKATPSLEWYLIAFFVYSMRVQTMMLIAAYLGEQEIQWGGRNESTIGLIVSVLITQLVIIIGARLTVTAMQRFGNIRVLIGLNVIWVSIYLLFCFVFKPVQFYALATLVGLIMGGIQSLSRSICSAYLPDTKNTTSFFSFYDVTEKLSIVIGAGIYGITGQLANNIWSATISLVIFFALGMLLLFRVKSKK